MRGQSWASQIDILREAADDDVISAIAMMGLGVPESTVYRRCRAGGPTILLAPGTILLGTGPPTRRQLLRAARIHAGPGAVVTGIDATRAHGLRRGEVPDEVHVLIEGCRQVRSVRGIRVERTTRLPEPVLRDGLPVAPIERCVLDAVRRLRPRADIAAIMTEPVQRRMVLPEALRTELDAGCRRGSATPRDVLRAIEDGVRSAAEFEVREWWLRHSELGRALFNVCIHDGDGTFLGIADVFVEEAGFVLAIDSVEQHFMTPDQVELTERQHRAYRTAGLHVMGMRPTRVRTDPVRLLRDVQDGLRVAGALPTAAVSWTPDVPRAV